MPRASDARTNTERERGKNCANCESLDCKCQSEHADSKSHLHKLDGAGARLELWCVKPLITPEKYTTVSEAVQGAGAALGEQWKNVRWSDESSLKKAEKCMQGSGQSKSTSLGARFPQRRSCPTVLFNPFNRRGDGKDGNVPKHDHKSADLEPVSIRGTLCTHVAHVAFSATKTPNNQSFLWNKLCHSPAGEVQKLQAKASCSCSGGVCGPQYAINSISVCVFLIFWQLSGVSFSFLEQLFLIKCVCNAGKEKKSSGIFYGSEKWILCWIKMMGVMSQLCH